MSLTLGHASAIISQGVNAIFSHVHSFHRIRLIWPSFLTERNDGEIASCCYRFAWQQLAVPWNPRYSGRIERGACENHNWGCSWPLFNISSPIPHKVICGQQMLFVINFQIKIKNGNGCKVFVSSIRIIDNMTYADLKLALTWGKIFDYLLNLAGIW